MLHGGIDVNVSHRKVDPVLKGRVSPLRERARLRIELPGREAYSVTTTVTVPIAGHGDGADAADAAARVAAAPVPDRGRHGGHRHHGPRRLRRAYDTGLGGRWPGTRSPCGFLRALLLLLPAEAGVTSPCDVAPAVRPERPPQAGLPGRSKPRLAVAKVVGDVSRQAPGAPAPLLVGRRGSASFESPVGTCLAHGFLLDNRAPERDGSTRRGRAQGKGA